MVLSLPCSISFARRLGVTRSAWMMLPSMLPSGSRECNVFELRLSAPGWISLLDLATGYRWACRVKARLDGPAVTSQECSEGYCNYLASITSRGKSYWKSHVVSSSLWQGCVASIRKPSSLDTPAAHLHVNEECTAGRHQEGTIAASCQQTLLSKGGPHSFAAPSTPRASVMVLPPSSDRIGLNLSVRSSCDIDRW